MRNDQLLLWRGEIGKSDKNIWTHTHFLFFSDMGIKHASEVIYIYIGSLT